MHRMIILILIILFTCSACGFGKKPEHKKRADRIMKKVAHKLQREKHLILMGIGDIMDDIKKITIGFQFYGEKSINEARELLVDAVESYLTTINEKKEFRPYLHNYPFTPKNIHIIIYFSTMNGHAVPAGEITIVSSNQGRITYLIHNPEAPTLHEYYEESFEEARHIYYSSLSNKHSYTNSPH